MKRQVAWGPGGRECAVYAGAAPPSPWMKRTEFACDGGSALVTCVDLDSALHVMEAHLCSLGVSRCGMSVVWHGI